MRDIVSGFRKKIGKNIFYFFIACHILFSNLFAQQTNNLQVIWIIPGNPFLRVFGYNLAHGDINNDGHQDIIVSADTIIGAGASYLGRAYLFYGNHIGDTTPDVAFKSPFEKGSPSTHVCSADINGDGFDDIIMGEDQANEGGGAVTIFCGGNPIDTVPDVIMLSPNYWDSFYGCAISSGDVNGDGYNDLIVGSYGTAVVPAVWYMGRVYIYYGGPNFDTIADVILNGGHPFGSQNFVDEEFGFSVNSNGDVNNDGFSDVIVGAPTFGMQYQGKIYVYFGGNPMDTIADVTMTGEGTWQLLGNFGVSFVRNNQTFDNAITSTPFWRPGPPPTYSRGKLYVLFGGNPMDSLPDVCMIGRTDTCELGYSMSTAGDINGDSFDDIVAGAPKENDDRGAAYIWLGGGYLDTIPDAWIKGDTTDEGIGWHVASAGDVDGDGRDEMMVSNFAAAHAPLLKVWVCKYTGQGVEEERLTHYAKRNMLEVYPNPAGSFFVIRSTLNATRWTLRMYDVTGTLVKEIGDCFANARNDNMVRVSLKGINPGIYFLQLNNDPNIKKLVITK